MAKTDHETEARAQLASRLADLATYVDHADDPDSDEGPTSDLGPVFDYGLEWAKDSLSYRDSTITYRHVISTGGPHEEFLVTFGRTTGGYGLVVGSVTFVSLPWFDRVEIELAGGELETAKAFYEMFFADLCDEDFDA